MSRETASPAIACDGDYFSNVYCSWWSCISDHFRHNLLSICIRSFNTDPLTQEIILSHRKKDFDDQDYQISTNLQIELKAFEGLDSLKELQLGHNLLKTVTPGLFLPVSSLDRLVIYANSLTVLEAGTFRGLTNLTILLLHANHLRVVHPDLLQDTPNLRKLWEDESFGNKELNWVYRNSFFQSDNWRRTTCRICQPDSWTLFQTSGNWGLSAIPGTAIAGLLTYPGGWEKGSLPIPEGIIWQVLIQAFGITALAQFAEVRVLSVEDSLFKSRFTNSAKVSGLLCEDWHLDCLSKRPRLLYHQLWVRRLTIGSPNDMCNVQIDNVVLNCSYRYIDLDWHNMN